MKTQSHAPRLAAIGMVLILCGCSSTSPRTHLYILNAPQSPVTEPGSKPTDTIIAVAPVELPKYLDRPSIITQVGNNELTFSEFHRWAGPLDDNIRQVLIENLSRKLHAAHIVPDSRGLPDAPDLHVKVSITDFSGTLGKAAHLQAVWTLSAADQSAAAGSFEKEIPLSSDRYTDYVSAQSILLGNLAEKIAEAISSP